MPRAEALVEYFRALELTLRESRACPNWTTRRRQGFFGWLGAHNGAAGSAGRPRPNETLPEKVRGHLSKSSRQKLRGANALAISDYGFGSAAPEGARACFEEDEEDPVTLDAALRINALARCGIVSATPNEAETRSFAPFFDWQECGGTGTLRTRDLAR